MAAKVAALERFRDAQEEVEQELAAARKMARAGSSKRLSPPNSAPFIGPPRRYLRSL